MRKADPDEQDAIEPTADVEADVNPAEPPAHSQAQPAVHEDHPAALASGSEVDLDVRRELPTYGDILKVHLGAKDDRQPFTIPPFMGVALATVAESVARATSRKVTPAQMAVWAWHQGLLPLTLRDEVRVIKAGREAVLRSGQDVLIAQLRWHYQIASRGPSERIFPRKVNPADSGTCSELIRDLGLCSWNGQPSPTLPTVAMMSGFDGIELPGDLARIIRDELGEFFRALRQRAALVQELQQRATAPPQLRRFSLKEVTGDE